MIHQTMPIRPILARRRRFLPTLVLGACAGILLAHGPVHEQIARVDRLLAEHPDDPRLHAKRGRLRLIDDAPAEALADFDRALALAPAGKETSRDAQLGRAEALLALGRGEEALRAVDESLRQVESGEDPGAVVDTAVDTAARAAGHTLRGDVLSALGRPGDAAAAYARALAASAQPSQELHLAHARALADAGDPASAVRSLDRAIEHLGALVVLRQEALEMTLRAGDIDDALRRVDALIADAEGPRRVVWLARRAVVLRDAGRAAEARRAYQEARQAFEEIPPHRRGARAFRELGEEIAAGLAEPDS